MGPYYYLYVICPAPTDCFFIGTSLQGCAFTMSITIYKSKCDLPLNTIFCIVGRPVSQKSVSTAVSFDSAQTLQTRQANPSHKPSIDFFSLLSVCEEMYFRCVCVGCQCRGKQRSVGVFLLVCLEIVKYKVSLTFESKLFLCLLVNLWAQTR